MCVYTMLSLNTWWLINVLFDHNHFFLLYSLGIYCVHAFAKIKKKQNKKATKKNNPQMLTQENHHLIV